MTQASGRYTDQASGTRTRTQPSGRGNTDRAPGSPSLDRMLSVELFAGAGGLALGCGLSGFHPQAVIEWDKWACDTVRRNQTDGHELVKDWPVIEGDVRFFDWSALKDQIDLVTGGPPCQPFSGGGKHLAADDERDMFPAATDVVRRLAPRAFIFENVRGLTRERFRDYYEYVQLRLRFPEDRAEPDETWFHHLERLRADEYSTCGDLRYNVVALAVNAANYGVPQQRHRVFLVGFREDQEVQWAFPPPTHTRDALLYDQWISGEYWERHKVPVSERTGLPSVATLARLQKSDRASLGQPWRTVRDAIADLPEPTMAGSRTHLNHILQPGARQYKGHTGSPIDLPAKTLKAGGHGVPGGENMLRRPDGSVRYFTVRESARLQTFPDDYELHGAWGEAMRQLGNAVPVLLAETVASSVASALAASSVRIGNQVGLARVH